MRCEIGGELEQRIGRGGRLLRAGRRGLYGNGLQCPGLLVGHFDVHAFALLAQLLQLLCVLDLEPLEQEGCPLPRLIQPTYV